MSMKRLILVMLIASVPVAPSINFDWREVRALAETAEVSAKDAFEAARELGTIDAWNAFLANYPTGFYADLARAYIKKLAAGGAVTPPTATPAPVTTPAPAVPAPTATPATPPDAGGKPVGVATPNSCRHRAYAARPARRVCGAPRGSPRASTATTPTDWKPTRTIHVSPAAAATALAAVTRPRCRPRRRVAPGHHDPFPAGQLPGLRRAREAKSGTYDEPVVLEGERN